MTSDSTSTTEGKIYEQTVRVFTTFFSALMGFGLKHLLDNPLQGAGRGERWWCFLIALMLLLRFLFGSANHLWDEYVRGTGDVKSRKLLMWDLLWIVAFGFLGLRMCYSADSSAFLFWNSVFGAVAAVVALIEAALRKCVRNDAGPWWTQWVFINAIHAACSVIGWQAYQQQGCGLEVLGVSLTLVALAVVGLVLLLWDVWHQLGALARTP